jgi:RNA polymerase sigma-70 factor (ECF subfamily)
MFRELSPRVYAFARRRADPSTAQEIVSDTFLIAWRRFADVPSEPLPWLLVVARNTLMDRARRRQRRDDLAETLAYLERSAGYAAGADTDLLEREQMLAALAELSDLEREALLMVGWDGLTNSQAAQVAGCSVRAFEVRLSRARARLSRAIESSSVDPPRWDALNFVSDTPRGVAARRTR